MKQVPNKARVAYIAVELLKSLISRNGMDPTDVSLQTLTNTCVRAAELLDRALGHTDEGRNA